MSHSKLLFLLPFLLTLTLLPPFAHSRQCPVLLPNYNAANTTTVTSETTRLPSHSTERIFRGKTLNSTLLPYVAALFYRDAGETKFFCSAIVVGPRTLLTAGHCVAIFLDEFIGFTNEDIEFYAYFGAQKTSTSGAIESQIKSIFMHPEYNILDTDTYPYDIAYVTLYNDIPPSNKIMKVNANSSNPVTGSVVRSIGYGAQKVFDDLNDQLQYESKDDVVQQLDLPVVRHSYCRTAWIDLSEAQNIPEYQHNIKANYQFCAGYLKGGCGLWYVLYYLFFLHHSSILIYMH